MTQLFLEAKKIIDQSHRILLVSHQDPDGDALGSMLGLGIALKKLGKEADVFCLSEIPASLQFLPNISQIKKEIDADYDLILGCDYGDCRRLETIASGACPDLPSITFDHHPLKNQTGRLKMIDSDFSSTCEIIYNFLKDNNLEVDKEIATCLLTGIFTDTWSFRHPTATAKTLKAVAELLSLGASFNKIVKLTYQNHIDIKSKIWSKALAGIRLDKELGLVFYFAKHKDLLESGANLSDLSGLSSLLCTVPGAKFSLLLAEFKPGYFDGSLRSLPDKGVDVSYIARGLGGGGHKLAAGFKFYGKPEEVLGKIKELMLEKQSVRL
ncbi:MAG: DHH family phosphoesterase [Candidatus Portnoybacteria bacterium]|nr:DHH family phosphoesterase [Candidatus Portnoybacteria bacterium]